MSGNPELPRRNFTVRMSPGEAFTCKAAARRNRMSLGEFLRIGGLEAAAECLEPGERAVDPPPRPATRQASRSRR